MSAETYNVNPVVPFVIDKNFKTRKAKIKQNATVSEDIKAGTLLCVDSDGKMSACVDAVAPATQEYPVCILLNDVKKDNIIAADVTADVVYFARVNKAFIVSVNTGLTVNEALIWNSLKNGLDIYELV